MWLMHWESSLLGLHACITNTLIDDLLDIIIHTNYCVVYSAHLI